jgi:hypothetical protein
MAIKTNLIVDQGANFIYNLYLIDEDGNIFDISGYTGEAQLRRTYTSSNSVSMNVTVDGGAGLISLSMNAETTSTLNQLRYVYDLELSANNVTSRIIEGFITVNPGVTR